ncbi:unnamed protein product [Acanthoscelides obtectus]|uniref:Serpin domain-containing protein n=1 Tax=Acanthoscelides obtectus TaxID=200917 RepID=A0A9P0KRB7_ACAOB|nr:unnamed protein product [Acanthoscelides obtectus]CAK1652665.1 Serpin A3-3 [Acanthoscelides obtectus]
MSQLSEGKINVKLQAGAVLALNSNNMPYKKFLDDARRWYKVELQPLNFDWSELASVNISDYIADKTSGRINNLVLFKDVNDNAPLMVVSYLDVTSKWLTRFDDKSTLMGQFHTINGEYELKYMINGEFYANITHNLDLEAKILRLPLQGGNLSMTFVLPDKKQGIHKLQRKLRKNLDSLWSDNSKYSFELLRTHITLPKFKIEHKLNAKKVLNQLGVNKIFEPDAELQNLAEGNGLCLTGITQKSVISVDEWGINAVSADHIKSDDDYQDEMIEEEEEERKMVPIEEFFIADRPFFFTLTIQPTDDVLFFGLYGGN